MLKSRVAVFALFLSPLIAACGSSLTVEVATADGAAVAWLYRRGQVLSREDSEHICRLTIALDPEDVGRLRQRSEIAVVQPSNAISIAAE